jgi:hypothetical protein
MGWYYMGFAVLKDAAVHVLDVGSKARLPHSGVRTPARQYAFHFDVNASISWSSAAVIPSLGLRLLSLSLEQDPVHD